MYKPVFKCLQHVLITNVDNDLILFAFKKLQIINFPVMPVPYLLQKFSFCILWTVFMELPMNVYAELRINIKLNAPVLICYKCCLQDDVIDDDGDDTAAGGEFATQVGGSHIWCSNYSSTKLRSDRLMPDNHVG